MIDSITIRSVQNSEVALFRDLRLQALRESPEAFDQTAEEGGAGRQLEYWQGLLDQVTAPSRNTMLIAFKGDTAVGVVYGFNKGNSIGSFGGMWISREHRKQGIASELIVAVLEWVKDADIETMQIWNVEGNQAAQNLYEKHGFVATGKKKALDDSEDRTIIQLEKKI